MNMQRRLQLLVLLTLALFAFACGQQDEDDPANPVDPNEPPDTNEVVTGPWFAIPGYGIQTESPSFIHVMFPVVDDSGQGVSDLAIDDFVVREDGSSLSPTESALHLRTPEVVPFRIYTVLAIDNSPSVAPVLDQIIESAKSLVAGMTSGQQMAVIRFDEEVFLVQEFTSDPAVLNSAIESIEPGYGGTNLYGAMISALGMWTDRYSVDLVEQGFLVVLTDGRDTAGRRLESDVTLVRGEKQVYTIGLGSEVSSPSLRNLGNSGYFPAADADDLIDQFIAIRERMVRYTESFYWLTYASPRRGNALHVLEISIDGNTNGGQHRLIQTAFNSADFYGILPGLYVNPDPARTDGIESAIISPDSTLALHAVSHLVNQAPMYVWSTDRPDIFELTVSSLDGDSCMVTPLGMGSGIISVADTVNSLSRDIELVVLPDPPGPLSVRRQFP